MFDNSVFKNSSKSLIIILWRLFYDSSYKKINIKTKGGTKVYMVSSMIEAKKYSAFLVQYLFYHCIFFRAQIQFRARISIMSSRSALKQICTGLLIPVFLRSCQGAPISIFWNIKKDILQLIHGTWIHIWRTLMYQLSNKKGTGEMLNANKESMGGTVSLGYG